MNENVIDALKVVMKYASDVNEWIIIKKEILKILPSEDRKLFSTRDPITKLQRTNEFEENVIKIWNEIRKDKNI